MRTAPDRQKSTGYLSAENFLTVFLHMSPLFLYPTYHTFNDGFFAITRYERRFLRMDQIYKEIIKIVPYELIKLLMCLLLLSDV